MQLSETAAITGSALNIGPFPMPPPLQPPTEVLSVPRKGDLTNAGKVLSRMLNGLGGRISLGMAASDVTRAELASACGLSEEQIRSLQAGEAGDMTIEQIASVAAALGLSPSIQFAALSPGTTPRSPN